MSYGFKLSFPHASGSVDVDMTNTSYFNLVVDTFELGTNESITRSYPGSVDLDILAIPLAGTLTPHNVTYNNSTKTFSVSSTTSSNPVTIRYLVVEAV